MENTNANALNFILVGPTLDISLSPLDSDSISNLAHMEQIVGTLVKQNDESRFEPYLTTSWEKTENGRNWEFIIRPNLTCENNEPITPNGYKESFQKIIKIYAKEKGSLPVFEKLYGFNDFISGKNDDLAGLIATDSSLIFKFTHSINSGLLEFLSMPYFGYYCVENFNKDSFNQENSFISSGAYSVKSFLTESKKVFLQKRPNWFSHIEGSADLIEISHLRSEEFKVKKNWPNKTLIFAMIESSSNHFDNFNKTMGVPEILVSLTLSPNTKSIFNNIANRAWFQSRLFSFKNNNNFRESSFQSNFFYPYIETKIETLSNIDTPELKGKTISIMLPASLTTEETTYIKKSIDYVFENVEVKLNYQTLERTEKNWMKKYTANDIYDIRVAIVSIGGTFENWLIEMMFCSNLGINFPDPNGKICNLVQSSNSNEISPTRYAEIFNQALYDEALVMPLFHKGYTWLLTKDINFKLSPTWGPPRFDLIQIQ